MASRLDYLTRYTGGGGLAATQTELGRAGVPVPVQQSNAPVVSTPAAPPLFTTPHQGASTTGATTVLSRVSQQGAAAPTGKLISLTSSSSSAPMHSTNGESRLLGAPRQKPATHSAQTAAAAAASPSTPVYTNPHVLPPVHSSKLAVDVAPPQTPPSAPLQAPPQQQPRVQQYVHDNVVYSVPEGGSTDVDIHAEPVPNQRFDAMDASSNNYAATNGMPSQQMFAEQAPQQQHQQQQQQQHPQAAPHVFDAALPFLEIQRGFQFVNQSLSTINERLAGTPSVVNTVPQLQALAGRLEEANINAEKFYSAHLALQQQAVEALHSQNRLNTERTAQTERHLRVMEELLRKLSERPVAMLSSVADAGGNAVPDAVSKAVDSAAAPLKPAAAKKPRGKAAAAAAAAAAATVPVVVPAPAVADMAVDAQVSDVPATAAASSSSTAPSLASSSYIVPVAAAAPAAPAPRTFMDFSSIPSEPVRTMPLPSTSGLEQAQDAVQFMLANTGAILVPKFYRPTKEFIDALPYVYQLRADFIAHIKDPSGVKLKRGGAPRSQPNSSTCFWLKAPSGGVDSVDFAVKNTMHSYGRCGLELPNVGILVDFGAKLGVKRGAKAAASSAAGDAPKKGILRYVCYLNTPGSEPELIALSKDRLLKICDVFRPQDLVSRIDSSRAKDSTLASLCADTAVFIETKNPLTGELVTLPLVPEDVLEEWVKPFFLKPKLDAQRGRRIGAAASKKQSQVDRVDRENAHYEAIAAAAQDEDDGASDDDAVATTGGASRKRGIAAARPAKKQAASVRGQRDPSFVRTDDQADRDDDDSDESSSDSEKDSAADNDGEESAVSSDAEDNGSRDMDTDKRRYERDEDLSEHERKAKAKKTQKPVLSQQPAPALPVALAASAAAAAAADDDDNPLLGAIKREPVTPQQQQEPEIVYSCAVQYNLNGKVETVHVSVPTTTLTYKTVAAFIGTQTCSDIMQNWSHPDCAVITEFFEMLVSGPYTRLHKEFYDGIKDREANPKTATHRFNDMRRILGSLCTLIEISAEPPASPVGRRALSPSFGPFASHLVALCVESSGFGSNYMPVPNTDREYLSKQSSPMIKALCATPEVVCKNASTLKQFWTACRILLEQLAALTG